MKNFLVSLLWLGMMSRGIFYLSILLADHFIPDHDAQGVVKLLMNGDSWISTFVKWDSVYYVRISLQGYQDDKDFAFFPLYPFLISLVMMILGNHSPETAVTVGLAINFASFLLTIPVLWKLLTFIPNITNNRIHNSLLFFIFSPCTVFFLTVYTESLFCLLSFSGMLFIHMEWILMSSLCFMLASLTRSNGIFNIIFIISHLFCFFLSKPRHHFISTFRLWIHAIYGSLLTSLPFFAYSLFVYSSLCPSPLLHTIEPDVSPVTLDPELCTGGYLSIYSSLQRKYWNVGFLRQYQLRQVPNFLLALPIISVVIYTLFISFRNRSNRPLLRSVLPYSLHLFSLLLVVSLTAHIQISTRVFLSSSPLLYLSLSDFLFPCPDTMDSGETNPAMARVVKFWWISYLIGGMVLHTNYYPWT